MLASTTPIATLYSSFDFLRFSYKHAVVKWDDSVILFKASRELLLLFFDLFVCSSRPQQKTRESRNRIGTKAERKKTKQQNTHTPRNGNVKKQDWEKSEEWGGGGGGESEMKRETRDLMRNGEFVKNVNRTTEMNEASLICSLFSCSGKRREPEVLPSVSNSSSLICHSQSSTLF